MHHATHRLAIIYLIVATVLFVLLTFAAIRTPYLPGDIEITRALQSFRSPELDLFMNLVGQPGLFPQTLVLNAIFVVIIFLCRMKWETLTLLVVGSMAGITGSLFRYGLDRPRPSPALVYVMQEIEKGHYSYPSGHTVGFTAVLGFFMYIGCTRLPPSWHRKVLLALYASYIVLVGISRIYTGEHWPSDVVAGYLLGSIFVILEVLFYQWLVSREKA